MNTDLFFDKILADSFRIARGNAKNCVLDEERERVLNEIADICEKLYLDTEVKHAPEYMSGYVVARGDELRFYRLSVKKKKMFSDLLMMSDLVSIAAENDEIVVSINVNGLYKSK